MLTVCHLTATGSPCKEARREPAREAGVFLSSAASEPLSEHDSTFPKPA